jgi:dihydropteroate synthase
MNYTLNCQGKLLHITKPIVMGIVNVTPDSFYKASRQQQLTDILATITKMIAEGATIIDIGAQSTRPDSTFLTASEEWQRLVTILPTILATFPNHFFSLDTFHSKVAKQALDMGIHIINDISGGTIDEQMMPIVGKYKAPLVCMHTKGTPQQMQSLAAYDNVVEEVLDYSIAQKQKALSFGIYDTITDPGFGFAKTIAHNFQLLNELKVLATIIDAPLLIGISRKSMIYKTLNISPEESLNGTTVLNTMALQAGAAILRVHDVAPAIEAINLVNAIHQ